MSRRHDTATGTLERARASDAGRPVPEAAAAEPFADAPEDLETVEHKILEQGADPPSGAARKAPPERTCIVTRTVAAPAEMIRFVVAPDGSVVPDIRRELPGRGVWVTATRDAVATAERKRLFARAFKAEVKVAPGLAERVDTLLEKAAVQAVSMARKAGVLVIGFTKVESALGKDDVAALITASDAAPDGIRKLKAAVMRRFGNADAIPTIRIFASGELDLALGLSNVIHAALLAGRASDGVLERARRVTRYRGLDVTDSLDGMATAGLAAPQD